MTLRPVGRPITLTPEIAEALAGHIRKGRSLRNACMLESIEWETFKVWRKRGKTGEKPYDFLFALTRQAEGAAESDFAAVVEGRAKSTNPDDGAAKAAQWWLERRRREDWWLAKPAKNVEPSKLSTPELVDALIAELVRQSKNDPAIMARVIEAVGAKKDGDK
jgi:hypothetical protein